MHVAASFFRPSYSVVVLKVVCLSVENIINLLRRVFPYEYKGNFDRLFHLSQMCLVAVSVTVSQTFISVRTDNWINIRGT